MILSTDILANGYQIYVLYCFFKSTMHKVKSTLNKQVTTNKSKPAKWLVKNRACISAATKTTALTFWCHCKILHKRIK